MSTWDIVDEWSSIRVSICSPTDIAVARTHVELNTAFVIVARAWVLNDAALDIYLEVERSAVSSLEESGLRVFCFKRCIPFFWSKMRSFLDVDNTLPWQHCSRTGAFQFVKTHLAIKTKAEDNMRQIGLYILKKELTLRWEGFSRRRDRSRPTLGCSLQFAVGTLWSYHFYILPCMQVSISTWIYVLNVVLFPIYLVVHYWILFYHIGSYFFSSFILWLGKVLPSGNFCYCCPALFMMLSSLIVSVCVR